MTDGLVQQDTRTAGSHHNGHFAAFGLDGLEEDSRIVHRFASQCLDNVVAQEFKALAVRTRGKSVLHLSVLFHDADGHERYHRAVVVVTDALGVAEKHVRGSVAQRGLHLAHTRVEREDFLVQFLQIRDFGLQADFLPRGNHGIAVLGDGFLGQSDGFTSLTRRSDAGSCTGSTQHFVECHSLDIGITRLVACQNADTHTEVDVRTATVHLSVHQRDAVVERMFEIEVGIIAAFFEGGSQYFLQIGFGHTEVKHRCSHGRLIIGCPKRPAHRFGHGQRRVFEFLSLVDEETRRQATRRNGF